MATAARHHILYDVERWRRYRTWLLMPATVFAMTAILVSLLKPTTGSAFGYAVAAAGLLAVASSLWTRQHFTYLACEGESLVIRSMAATRRLEAADIDRAKLIKLAAVFSRPERRRLLPRPAERWLATEAISIRLRDGVDLRALRRAVGPRCVIEDTLVVPVAGAADLYSELITQVCPPRPVVSAAGTRRRGRRR